MTPRRQIAASQVGHELHRSMVTHTSTFTNVTQARQTLDELPIVTTLVCREGQYRS